MLNNKVVDGIRVVRMTENRLHASRAPTFRTDMADLIACGHDRVVLDLSGVRFMDSSGVGALSLKQLEQRGTMAAAGAAGAVRKPLTLTRMDRMFVAHHTVDAAVAQMNA